MTDVAAALTYYAVLSIFPMLLALVALIGVFGQYPRTVSSIMQMVGKVAPRSTVDTLRSTLTGVVRDKGGAGALLGVGTLGALWSASGYVGAFARACNGVYGIDEQRRAVRLRLQQLSIAAGMVLAMAFVAIGYVFSGKLAHSAGNVLGVSGAVVSAWQIAKWPVMALLCATLLLMLYRLAPNLRESSLRSHAPGSAVALLVLLVASTGFAFYLTSFGSYNETYGALGGVIALLVWLWIVNVAVLFGVQVNAELPRGRAAAESQATRAPPPESEDARKMPHT